jgi:hypothetical protein
MYRVVKLWPRYLLVKRQHASTHISSHLQATVGHHIRASVIELGVQERVQREFGQVNVRNGERSGLGLGGRQFLDGRSILDENGRTSNEEGKGRLVITSVFLVLVVFGVDEANNVVLIDQRLVAAFGHRLDDLREDRRLALEVHGK